MGITYRIDAGRRLVVATASRKLERGDPERYLEALAADPAFAPGMRALVDFRGIETIDFHAEDAYQLASRAEELGAVLTGSKVAVAAGSDAVYGMGRMYEALRTDAPYALRIFRTLEEALAWLELEPDALEAPERGRR